MKSEHKKCAEILFCNLFSIFFTKSRIKDYWKGYVTMFTENDDLFISESRWNDFVKNSANFGFQKDSDGNYYLKKNLSQNYQMLRLRFSIPVSTRKIQIEFETSSTYWFDIGFATFEPLWELYHQDYLEISNRDVPFVPIN